MTEAEYCVDLSSQDLNRRLGPDLKHLLESLSPEVDDASFISIDGKGVDIRVRQGAQVSGHSSGCASISACSWRLILLPVYLTVHLSVCSALQTLYIAVHRPPLEF